MEPEIIHRHQSRDGLTTEWRINFGELKFMLIAFGDKGVFGAEKPIIGRIFRVCACGLCKDEFVDGLSGFDPGTHHDEVYKQLILQWRLGDNSQPETTQVH